MFRPFDPGTTVRNVRCVAARLTAEQPSQTLPVDGSLHVREALPLVPMKLLLLNVHDDVTRQRERSDTRREAGIARESL